ncbi:MAG: MopE-related protein [Myxococcota bacterium]
MPRRVLAGVLLVALSGCGKAVGVGGSADSGLPDSSPVCTVGGECPPSQRCVLGACVDAQDAVDAGFLCFGDEDCPKGLQCLRSRGECVAPAPEVDAGPPPVPACTPGEERSCGQSKLGECRLGVSRCEADDAGVFAFTSCLGAVEAGAEACDGKDNDCDGLTDEGLGDLSCGVGACLRTVAACAQGLMATCTPGTPTAEACNGVDDDCDGSTDEGLPTVTCGVGACARSQPSCVGGVPQTCTPGPTAPESCNGVDDDCNGVVDDGLPTLTCGVGACARSVASCVAGQAQQCAPGAPSSEVCNGLDDDCDGQVDDGFGSQACGVGLCARTVQACASGAAQVCTPGSPVSESCNGLDDDCDGTVDDGFGLVSCGVGACARTVPACLAGLPQSCTPGAPSTEVCNGLDDDCDGQADEGQPTVTCGQGICQRSIASCVGGVPQVCTPGAAQAETCDGLDNDCDGQTDEGCNCLNGQTRSCYSGPGGTQGVGRCQAGTQLCTTGQWGACMNELLPSTELCNALDDDCDGQTDEALGNVSCGQGACARTVAACVGGTSQVCTPGAPSLEVCNGVDDDCDGLVDDNLGSLSCGAGACARTVAACVGGLPQTCTPGTPSAELCDGVDNDCDGATDEALGNLSCGQGACARTVAACVSGVSQTCTPGNPVTEACDGVDNDCDGVVDDGFGNVTCGQGVCQRTVAACVSGAPQTCTPGTPSAESCNSQDDDCDGTVDDGTCAPTAMCPAGQTVNPNTSVTLTTSAASPAGRPLTCQWSVVSRPATSSGVFSAPTSCGSSSYYADVVGTHVLRFTVTDSMGLSSSCDVTITVQPMGDLWVELTWNQPNDMDLHLLHPSGGNRRQANNWSVSPWDCYFVNTNPSWDNPGTADDPSLDRDDISGTGPENIRINTPSIAHTYAIGVHMYSWAASPTPVVTTVRVYCAGQLKATQTRSFSTVKEFWVVGVVDFAGAGSAGCFFTPDGHVMQKP